LKRVRDPDAVTIERLEQFLHEENGKEPNGRPVTILLAGVRPDTLKVLTNIGFEAWFPPDQVFPEEAEEYSATLKAVRYAQARLVSEQADVDADPKLYYLV
jgi:sulfate permease, SulP family